MKGPWLIEPEAGAELREARVRFGPADVEALAGKMPTIRGKQHRVLEVELGVARINVLGVLTPSPDPLAAFFFGSNTTYADIVSGLENAERDPSVKSVELHIESPGGSVVGLFDAMAAVRALSKPSKAIARSALSAAYGVASQAGTLEATGPDAEFGSIGVAASVFLSDSLVEVASTDAPKKRPDARTAGGKAMIREHLDQIHNLFARAIATGRRTTVDNVNLRYGQGGVLLAERAQVAGMIDRVEPTRTSLRASDGARSRAFAGARAQPDDIEEQVHAAVTAYLRGE